MRERSHQPPVRNAWVVVLLTLGAALALAAPTHASHDDSDDECLRDRCRTTTTFDTTSTTKPWPTTTTTVPTTTTTVPTTTTLAPPPPEPVGLPGRVTAPRRAATTTVPPTTAPTTTVALAPTTSFPVTISTTEESGDDERQLISAASGIDGGSGRGSSTTLTLWGLAVVLGVAVCAAVLRLDRRWSGG